MTRSRLASRSRRRGAASSCIALITVMAMATAMAATATAQEHSTDAAAQEHSAVPPARAGGRARLVSVLPTLDIGVATDGTAQVAVGLDWVLGISNGWDLSLSPWFRARAQSIAQLFASGDGDAGKSWLLGGTLTFIQLGLRLPRERPGAAGPVAAIKQAAFDACRAACGRANASAEEQAFCALSDKLAASEIDDGEFCAEGKQLLRGALPLHEWRGRFPRLMLSIGAMGGSNGFDFLMPQLKADTARLPWLAQHVRESDFAVATSITFVGDNGLTVELPLTVARRWQASTVRANACVDLGVVAPNPNGQGPPLQSCRDYAVGAPTSIVTVFSTLQLGYVLRPSGFFRASAGPLFSYADLGADTQTTVGLQAPIYINFANAPPRYVGDYRGLVRLTPAALFVKSSAGWDTRLVLLVDLLGQRTLFGKALDWL